MTIYSSLTWLAPVVLLLLAVSSVVFTGRDARLKYTISQHVGSNRVISVLFGVVCMVMALLVLFRQWVVYFVMMPRVAPDMSIPEALMSFGWVVSVHSLMEVLFAVCLAVVGVCPHLLDEKRRSSRVHQVFAQLLFFAMTAICALWVYGWVDGRAGWLFGVLSTIALIANLAFGVLYVVRRKVLGRWILVWESMCVLLFMCLFWY